MLSFSFISSKEKIEILKEEGFVDFIFPVKSYDVLDEESIKIKIKIKGKYKKNTIEFELITKKCFKAGITNGEFNRDAFEKNGILLIIDKINTKKIIELFTKEYGISLRIKDDFVNRIYFTVFPLEEVEKDVLDSEVKLKVFHDEEGNYYELYINLNLKEKKVEFKEKDKEYRENIIRSFINK